MPTYLNFAAGTLLLFLFLLFAPLAASQLVKQLVTRLARGALGAWLIHNETLLTLSIWAAVALATFFIGPKLLLMLTIGISLITG